MSMKILVVEDNPTVAQAFQLLSATPKESAILKLFLQNPQKVFSIQAILEQVWTVKAPSEKAVRVHIRKLQQKLMAAGAPKDFIAQHRVGYQLNPRYSDFSGLETTAPFPAPQLAEVETLRQELHTPLE